MRVAITGASGMVGVPTLAAARASGHDAVPLSRRGEGPAIDLRRSEGLAEVLHGSEAVVHLAAAMTGPDLEADNARMTATLLNAMAEARVNRLVLMSSLSVLDVKALPAGATVDASVPRASGDEGLGPYARAKRAQEVAAEAWRAGDGGRTLFQLRAGLVYGPGRLAPAHAGFGLRELGLTVTHDGEVPVLHVAAAADAVCRALSAEPSCEGAFLLVDDGLPTQTEYLRALSALGALPAWSTPVPWRVFSGLAGAARGAARLAGRPAPETFRAGSVAARYRPLRFRNDAAKAALRWDPGARFSETFR
ncbi:MAG: NAD(P)-dependent oxidoreductase [Myxococcota bacterium]